MRMPRRARPAVSVSTNDGTLESMSVELSTRTWMSTLSTAMSCDNELSRGGGYATTSGGLGPERYFTPSNSTSNISVAFGGMTPPAPRAP